MLFAEALLNCPWTKAAAGFGISAQCERKSHVIWPHGKVD